jgi:hypothetical protein
VKAPTDPFRPLYFRWSCRANTCMPRVAIILPLRLCARETAGGEVAVGAVCLVFRIKLRRHWRSWLLLSLLIAVFASFVLAATAASRRTDSAFPRYVACLPEIFQRSRQSLTYLLSASVRMGGLS